jgi:uncharacterized protein
VSELIKGYGQAVEKLESGAASVHPEFKDGSARERVTGYVARAGFTVTVGDFAVLGERVPRLGAEEVVAVTGPAWRLRPDSHAYRQVRLAAAGDTIQRARESRAGASGSLAGRIEARLGRMLIAWRSVVEPACHRGIPVGLAPEGVRSHIALQFRDDEPNVGSQTKNVKAVPGLGRAVPQR